MATSSYRYLPPCWDEPSHGSPQDGRAARRGKCAIGKRAWRRLAIAADLETVSLLDVHRAVGGARLFAIGDEHPHADCTVEKVVNAAVGGALHEAEMLLVARKGAVTLAELARAFDAQCRPAT